MNMGAQAGGALTASLTPWIAARYGWTASFLVAAALCGIGAFAWLLVDPDRKQVAQGGKEFGVADLALFVPPISRAENRPARLAGSQAA